MLSGSFNAMAQMSLGFEWICPGNITANYFCWKKLSTCPETDYKGPKLPSPLLISKMNDFFLKNDNCSAVQKCPV